MRWRDFASAVKTVFVRDKPAKSAGGLQTLYDDAMKLINRIYAGKSKSRRNRPRGMSERRWRAAYQLLRDTDVLDTRGEVWPAMAPDWDTAEWRVRTELERRREREAQRTYVTRR